MQRNVPLNGVRGWQRKKAAVAHDVHWPYGALDFSQTPEGQFSSVASNHVAPSSSEDPSTLTQQNLPNSQVHNDAPTRGMPAVDSQRRMSATSSPRVGRRVARPRRGHIRRRIASPTLGTSTTTTRTSSYMMNDPAVSYPHMTFQHAPRGEMPEQLNPGSEIQSRYTLPPGMNADLMPRSFDPVSIGTFESRYPPAHFSEIQDEAARRSFYGSSVSSHPTSSNEILFNSNCYQPFLYPNTTAYLDNSLTPDSSLSTQHQRSTSSTSLSTDSSAYGYHSIQRGIDYEFRERVNSQSSIAHAITPIPSYGFQQGVATGINPSFHVAEHYCSSSHSSSASAASSPPDTFSPYLPSSSRHVHLTDMDLQDRTYAEEMDLDHLMSTQGSFPAYTYPDSDETLEQYYYDPTHQK